MLNKEQKKVSLKERLSCYSEENKTSINILHNIAIAELLEKKENEVVFYFHFDNKLSPLGIKCTTKEYLNAVDYYIENKDERKENLETATPDNNIVDIYEPYVEGQTRRIVMAKIDKSKIPQMFEFAYLLVRSSQRKK